MTFGVKGIGQQYVRNDGFELLGGAIHHGTAKAFTKPFWIPWIAVGF